MWEGPISERTKFRGWDCDKMQWKARVRGENVRGPNGAVDPTCSTEIGSWPRGYDALWCHGEKGEGKDLLNSCSLANLASIIQTRFTSTMAFLPVTAVVCDAFPRAPEVAPGIMQFIYCLQSTSRSPCHALVTRKG